MSNLKKRRELPVQFTEHEIKSLGAEIFYPAQYYNSALGIKTITIALQDFEKGCINPAEVRFRGLFRPGQRNQRPRIMISGREIRRVYFEGRRVGQFALSVQSVYEKSTVEKRRQWR